MHEAVAASNTGRTRLHITPFDPALLNTVVPVYKQNLIASVSYHKTQCDPERGFGFIDLPEDEAERLQRKLNGTTLRGMKMSIEKARPVKRKAIQEAGQEREEARPRKKANKKSTASADIAGIELPAGRKVKRGWTEANTNGEASKSLKRSSRDKSKYTEKEEVLFRTGKEKADKKVDTKTGKTKNPKKEVVHEFEKTNKYPTFLKQSQPKRSGGPLTFEDGKGWVDDDGNVVEAVKSRTQVQKGDLKSAEDPHLPLGITGVEQEPTATVDSESIESAESSSSEASSDSSDSSDDDSDDADTGDADSVTKPSDDTPATALTPPSSMIAPSTEMQPPPNGAAGINAPPTKPIHPLEALYKRRPEDLPRPAPIKTSFSFFGGGDNEEKGSAVIPQTPFTQQDLRNRGMRSAAPTPDTAVASRRFFSSLDANADDASEDEERTPRIEQTELNTASNSTKTGKERPAFVQHFYDKRSELNKSYKQRGREARKLVRQRESGSTRTRPL